MKSHYREQGVENYSIENRIPGTILSTGCSEVRRRTTAIGSVIDGSGRCGKDVDGRIKVVWSRWRDLSAVIYDKKVPVNLKKQAVQNSGQTGDGVRE